ncbi:MAG: hypothetical protein JWM31_2844 [Solirubrobacterales bacterium]|nr:hypothetical protein [Solirubrobacterales bacterium]
MSVPHMRWPVRFANGKALTVEQDSPQDQAQRALLVLSYPLGGCVDLPGFGTADTTFGQSGADLNEFAIAVNLWEPDIPASVVRTVIDRDGTDHIDVNVGGG